MGNDFIKWCPECKGRILTTRQVEEGKSCEECQRNHAEGLKDRLEAQNKEE